MRLPDLIRTAKQATADPLGALPTSAASSVFTEHRQQGAAEGMADAGDADMGDAKDVRAEAKAGTGRGEEAIEVELSDQQEKDEVDSSDEEEVDSSKEESRATTSKSRKRARDECQSSTLGASPSHSAHNSQLPQRARAAINRFS
eukprot:2020022-Pleurochrysis_carterae.AAC.1